MAFNWFMSWISTIFSYASQEDKKQGRKKKRKKKIPISKECNGPCDLAQDNGTLADPFRTTCQGFQYNWDNGKIATSFKIHFFGKEFNILLAVCLHIFADNAKKQGQDLNKEDKGSSNLCRETFAHEAEKQGHDLIKECEVKHGLSQEKTIDNLKDWELTESIYSFDFSYLPKEKDGERQDSSEDFRKLSECSSDSSYVSKEKGHKRTYSSEDSRKLSESICSSDSSYVSKEKDHERTYSSEDSRKLSESICSSDSSYVSKEKDHERPDSSEDSRKLSENNSGSWYRKPQDIPSSDVVKIARKKKNKKRPDSSGYEGQSENSRKGSPSSDFRYVPVKQDTSVDKPSKTYAKSVTNNLKPSNYPEKKEDRPYNQGHHYNQSNKDFEDYQKTPNFKPVIIDGCNIGHEYGRKKGNRKNFSAKGLWIAYSFFKDLGYMDNQIVIIQRHIPEKYLKREDLDIMDNLRDLKVLKEFGSRIVQDAGLQDLIQPDNNLLIIKIAWELNGISKKI